MLKLTRTLALALALAAAIAVGPIPAVAEVFTHAKAGLQFTLPDSWNVTTEGDSLEALSGDESVIMWFDVIAPRDLDAYLKEVDKDISRHLQKVKVTTDETTEVVNGLKQHYLQGTAMANGEPVAWDLTLVEGGKMVLCVLAAGDDLDNKTVMNIYRSIKK